MTRIFVWTVFRWVESGDERDILARLHDLEDGHHRRRPRSLAAAVAIAIIAAVVAYRLLG